MGKARGKYSKSQRPYQPPEWAYRYVLAVLDPEIKPTKSARCEVIGIDRTTLWEAERNPAFVGWFQQAIQIQMHDAHEVRNALVRKCLSGDLEAIRFYYEKFGDFIPATKTIIEGLGDAADLTDAQLADIAKVLGAGSAQGTGPKVH